jgi:hypothetical protein
MSGKRPARVREQVVVYLEPRDRALLDEMAEKTGLARTELFRRGLRRLADETLSGRKRGASLRYLVATAGDDEFPADVSARPDDYLYGGEYGKRPSSRGKRKRARVR